MRLAIDLAESLCENYLVMKKITIEVKVLIEVEANEELTPLDVLDYLAVSCELEDVEITDQNILAYKIVSK